MVCWRRHTLSTPTSGSAARSTQCRFAVDRAVDKGPLEINFSPREALLPGVVVTGESGEGGDDLVEVGHLDTEVFVRRAIAMFQRVPVRARCGLFTVAGLDIGVAAFEDGKPVVSGQGVQDALDRAWIWVVCLRAPNALMFGVGAS